MSLVKDAADAIDVVVKAIENVRKIVSAVQEGKDYLTVKHPEAKTHVAAMLAEMEKTMLVVARASAVLTNFWFSAKSEASIERFNVQFQEHKARAAELRANIDALRGHCGAIRAAASDIEGKALVGRGAFTPIFVRLGLHSKKREEELGDLLHDLANEDFEVANTAQQMVAGLDASLAAVQGALGPGRVMDAANIPQAAALLDEHAKAFEPLETKATTLAGDIHTLVDALKL